MAMNNTVWKFPLSITDRQYILMPIGAEILTVQIHNSTPCLWAIVDPHPEKEREMRHIGIVGTGHPIYFKGEYISTIQTNNGSFVLHVFEIHEP